jgi:DNA replication protein DnaC
MESFAFILRRLARDLEGSSGTGGADPGGSGNDPAPEPSCPLCRGAGYVYRDVPVDHPDFGKAVPCQCTARQFEARRRELLRQRSNLGPFERLTFENLRPEGRTDDPFEQARFRNAYETARAYAEEPQGWLVLTGASGTGKTHLAAAIANRCLDRGLAAYFAVTPDLLDHLRATFGPSSEVSYDELFDYLRQVDLLVLDDFGAQAGTPWAHEKLFQLMNYRYVARLPTVVVLAGPLDLLEDRLRMRLTDPDLSRVVELGMGRPRGIGLFEPLRLELLRQMTFENFELRADLDPEQGASLTMAYELARNFAENPEGWLVFLGTCGCGKTHLAAAIANHRLKRRLPVVFAVVPDLLDHLRSTFNPDSRITYDELFESLRTSPVLILDDLGAHSSSPWAQEKLYQLINYRYNARLPTVITSNHRLEEIDPRLASRMSDRRLSTVVNILAPDYRIDRQDRPPDRRVRRSG